MKLFAVDLKSSTTLVNSATRCGRALVAAWLTKKAVPPAHSLPDISFTCVFRPLLVATSLPSFGLPCGLFGPACQSTLA